MNNLSVIKPYAPTFKATPPQKQAEGNYTFYEMNDGVLPYAAISKHRKNQKAGKEDDHITQTVMKHLTSPKRLLKCFIFDAASMAFGAACINAYRKPVIDVPAIIMAMAVLVPFTQFFTAGTMANIELSKEQGNKQPWLNEFFYKVLKAD